MTTSEDGTALRERRDALRARLAAIRADVARGLDRDAEERAVELENADVLDEIARVTALELEDVERRLRALDRGAR